MSRWRNRRTRKTTRGMASDAKKLISQKGVALPWVTLSNYAIESKTNNFRSGDQVRKAQRSSTVRRRSTCSTASCKRWTSRTAATMFDAFAPSTSSSAHVTSIARRITAATAAFRIVRTCRSAFGSVTAFFSFAETRQIRSLAPPIVVSVAMVRVFLFCLFVQKLFVFFAEMREIRATDVVDVNLAT